jgi:hypothetical protein
MLYNKQRTLTEPVYHVKPRRIELDDEKLSVTGK